MTQIKPDKSNEVRHLASIVQKLDAIVVCNF